VDGIAKEMEMMSWTILFYEIVDFKSKICETEENIFENQTYQIFCIL
jgi:hypothetical protein